MRLLLVLTALLFSALVSFTTAHRQCTSWGDPHIITFAKTKYDMYASGEFVYMTGKGFTVTARSAKRKCTKKQCLESGIPGLNRAVAYKYGSTIFAFYANHRVYVNGVKKNIPNDNRWRKYGQGKIKRRNSKYYDINFPGSRYGNVKLYGSYLNFDIRVAGSDNNARGLCGKNDGSRKYTREFIARDGTYMAPHKTKTYGGLSAYKFVQSWHVKHNEMFFEKPVGSFWTAYNAQVRYQKTHYVKAGRVKPWANQQVKAAAELYCGSLKMKTRLETEEYQNACLYDARQQISNPKTVKILATRIKALQNDGRLARHKESKGILKLIAAIKTKIGNERSEMKRTLNEKASIRSRGMEKQTKEMTQVKAQQANALKAKNTAAGQIASAKQAFGKATDQYNTAAGQVKAQAKTIKALSEEHSQQAAADQAELKAFMGRTDKELKVIAKIISLINNGK